jgi:hypothetical protein
MTLADQRRLDQIILGMVSRPDVKHSIQFFERSGLGLGQAEPRKDKSKEVPRGVEAEGALRCEGFEKRWPCQCEDEIETPACGCRKSHACITYCKWLYGYSSVWFFLADFEELTKDSAEYVKGTGPIPGL